jgi:hypothetical protein
VPSTGRRLRVEGAAFREGKALRDQDHGDAKGAKATFGPWPFKIR